MIKSNLKRASLLLFCTITLSLICSCGHNEPFSYDNFETNENIVKKEYAFDIGDKSESAQFDYSKLEQLEIFLSNTTVDYGYQELFNYEQALSGIDVNHSVVKHKYSALDNNGVLSKESLFDCVRKNNVEYLNGQSSVLKDIEDDTFLLRICEIIVDTTNNMLSRYSDIDKNRVYCNLGNLKIIEQTSALDLAAVSPEMTLHINRYTSQMAGAVSDSNMYNVLVHETMHILQFGCECENIEGCTRRCGLAHSYSGREQDYSDWTWMAEGSAERMASLYANVEPMTYKNYVNYLLTLNLITVLREDVSANYVETIYFYTDVDKLFSLFNAESDEEKREIYNMVYSLEIMQVEPDDVKKAYQKQYGVEWTEDIREEVNNKLKRPIIQTFTKIFYNNLINALSSNSLSKNDVLFLINLYESTINYHLCLNNSEYDGYNSDFIEWYANVQKLFFESFENLSLDEYMCFLASDDNNKTIHAGMKWLNEEKQLFLIEKFEDNLCDFKFK